MLCEVSRRAGGWSDTFVCGPANTQVKTKPARTLILAFWVTHTPKWSCLWFFDKEGIWRLLLSTAKKILLNVRSVCPLHMKNLVVIVWISSCTYLQYIDYKTFMLGLINSSRENSAHINFITSSAHSGISSFQNWIQKLILSLITTFCDKMSLLFPPTPALAFIWLWVRGKCVLGDPDSQSCPHGGLTRDLWKLWKIF